MSEKQVCWCGKELVAIGPPDQDHGSVYRPMVCPTHGENWQLPQATVAMLVEAVRASVGILRLTVAEHDEPNDSIENAVARCKPVLAALPKGADDGDGD